MLSFLLLVAMPGAPSSFVLLLVRHLFLIAMHLFLVAMHLFLGRMESDGTRRMNPSIDHTKLVVNLYNGRAR